MIPPRCEAPTRLRGRPQTPPDPREPRTTPHRMSTIGHMPHVRDYSVSTRVDAEFADWLTNTAHDERRSRSNLLWSLLEEARAARTAQTAGRNGHAPRIAGQTEIPLPNPRQ